MSSYEKITVSKEDEDLWKRIPIEYAIPLAQLKDDESRVAILVYLLLWETVQSMLALGEKDPSKSKGMLSALLHLLKDPRIYSTSFCTIPLSLSSSLSSYSSSRILPSQSSSMSSRFNGPSSLAGIASSTSTANLLHKSLLESKVEADGVLSKILKIYHAPHTIPLSSKAIIYFSISQVLCSNDLAAVRDFTKSTTNTNNTNTTTNNNNNKGGLRMIGLQQLLEPQERTSINRRTSNALGIFEWRSKTATASTTKEVVSETFMFFLESLPLLLLQQPQQQQQPPMLRIVSLTSLDRFINNLAAKHTSTTTTAKEKTRKAHTISQSSKNLEDWVAHTERCLEELKRIRPELCVLIEEAFSLLMQQQQQPQRQRQSLLLPKTLPQRHNKDETGFSLGSIVELLLIMMAAMVISLLLGFIKEL